MDPNVPQTPQVATVNPNVPPTPPHSKLPLILGALVFLLIGIGTGLVISRQQTSKPAVDESKVIAPLPTTAASQIPSPTTQPSSTPATNETSNWKTYTDTKLGYTLKYPPSWTVEKPSNTMGTLEGESTTFVSDTKFSNGLEGGPYSVGASYISNPSKKDFKALIAEQQQLSPEYLSQTFKFTTDTINGVKVYRTTTLPAQWGVDDVFFEKDGGFLRVGLNPINEEKPFAKQEEMIKIFEQIISTIKLTN